MYIYLRIRYAYAVFIERDLHILLQIVFHVPVVIGPAPYFKIHLHGALTVIGDTYEPHTPRTHTTIDELWADILTVRSEGIAHDYGEITDSVECLAAPVHINGTVAYGLGISVPSYRLTPEKRAELATLLKQSSTYLETILA